MPSSDLPPRPWIYADQTGPRPPFSQEVTERLSAEYEEVLRRARSGDVGFAVPEDVEIGTFGDHVEEYDAMAIRQQMHEMIVKARTMRLPLDGARLHLGRDVFDDLCRQVKVQAAVPGALTAFWGVPLVVEEGTPGLVELRWTIRV